MIDLVKVGFDVAVSPVPPADAILVRRRLGTLSPIVCASPLYLQNIRWRNLRPTWLATTVSAIPTLPRLQTSGFSKIPSAIRSLRADLGA